MDNQQIIRAWSQINSIIRGAVLKIIRMKALMKGNAAKYFEKKEKPVEDIETTMNQIEAKTFAKYLGIGQHEIQNFAGFFQTVFKTKLPRGYRRQLSADRTKVLYYNEISNQWSDSHPNLHIIKPAFYAMLKNSKTVPTFETKAAKLLTFVEEKLMRQCIGLNSKRRDAQKNNVQRDEEGKVVISKMGRVQPNMKSLISSRSYMLKALVQKIYTRKEVWGKGKRALVYSNILASYRSQDHFGEEDNEVENEQSLEKYQSIFQTSANFYQQNYGELIFIPQQLKNTRAYFRSTPESVIRNFILLNVDETSIQLYWLGRLMECLPLPPNWAIKLGDSFDQYVFEPAQLVFDLHPSYIYVIQLMNLFKIKFQLMDLIQQNYYNSMREMVFYDFFQRPYSVDLLGLIHMEHEGPITKKKAAKKSVQLATNDWMALEVVKNLSLPEQQYPLIGNLLNFWSTLNYREEIFLPSISPFGEIAWSSCINKKVVDVCPYAPTLKVLHEQSRLFFPQVENKDLKSFEEEAESEEDLIYNIFPKIREDFLAHYIRSDQKFNGDAYEIPSFAEKGNFLNEVFISPFNLQRDLKLEDAGETMPLWLQKVHAQRISNRNFSLLEWTPDSFENVKAQFCDYALEMVRNHEPEREQQVIKIIEKIEEPSSLKQFIKHINDLDGREERKRLANLGMVQEKQDSFGSSLSQIQMEERGDEEESQSQSMEIDVDFDDDDQPEAEEIEEQSIDQKKQEIIQQKKQEPEQESKEEEKMDKEPEKYFSVIYEKDPEIENLAEADLTIRLDSLVRNKELKHKYSHSSIRQKISSLQYDEKSKQVKRNLLVSGLHTDKVPYRSIHSIFDNRKPERIETPPNFPDTSEDFPGFRSQFSNYDNSRIVKQIQLRANILKSEESVESEYPEHKKQIDQTKQTIQLQPIKRIKPDINEDPRLQHISSISNLAAFSRIFNPANHQMLSPEKNKSTMSTINPETVKKQIDKNLQKKLTIFQSTDNQPKQMAKSKSVMGFAQQSTSLGKTGHKFNRICLEKTASYLLNTEPLTRRGDLIQLEAKKTLVSTCRGLSTKIAKGY